MMASLLAHFLIVVTLWIGAWGIIDGVITFYIPESKPLLRLVAYAVLFFVGVVLYAWTTPKPEDIPRRDGVLVI